MQAYIANFELIRPPYELSQEMLLDWIASAHTKAESQRQNGESFSAELFHQELKERLFKIGLGAEKIQKRASYLSDVLSQEWEHKLIYQLDKGGPGKNLKERLAFFERAVDEIFEIFYPETKALPSHMIHTTCTGYVSPSGAQKLLSKRKGETSTAVLHAYHMGCYASIPALRMALGCLYTPPFQPSRRVDIIHTELCSLHMNPLLHETEQLVVQSLFADGCVKYSSELLEKAPSNPSFCQLALHEELIPDSSASMTWRFEEWGLRMTIAKEVPVLIARALPSFLKEMAAKTDLSYEDLLKKAIFAIHPGGPKIISQVGTILNLSSKQLKHSQTVLRECGNMSSATLPYVWHSVLQDSDVKAETPIVSLAFGPGLTIAGAIFRKMGDI